MDRIRRKWRQSTKKRPVTRFIYLNNEIPDGATPPEGYDLQKYSDNMIKTSKYTIWNFLPKNLFEQFRRIANFYFFCVAIIQVVGDSPTSPWTSLLPLVFVVVVTAIKQGYEDFLRHRNDREVNLRLVEVVRNGLLQKIHAKDLKVGDILKIDDEDSFPCDIVLLSSAGREGKCYITTANLDGETNYKEKLCPRLTRAYNDPVSLRDIRGAIQCEHPTVNLYEFKGTLTTYSGDDEGIPEMAPLGLDNILLRGARLKDTEYIYGCAVYTGSDTKLALNSLLTNNKFSTVERSMNWFLIVFLILLIVEILLCTLQKYMVQATLDDAFYLHELIKKTSFRTVVSDMASFLIIFNYVIPISLYVTLEMQKFFGSMFFVWDEELYCPIADERPVCNSSDLNEELGQVQYLLTDKTGTLTENCMEFRQCSVGGAKYLEKNDMLQRVSENGDAVKLEGLEVLTPDVEEFLLTLALCHTVTICGYYRKTNNSERNSRRKSSVYNQRSQIEQTVKVEEIEYQGSSPDEKALAEACLRFGVIYMGEHHDCCRVIVKGERRRYQRLDVLEFDSTRKRMSVIVKLPNGTVRVLCKGAESAIIPRCTTGPLDETERHVCDFASDGLRTLAIAVRDLTDDEYERLSGRLKNARQSLADRDKEVSEVCDEIESNMRLLGATGVEDQLQDGVPETLQALREAGVKVWVLTGDKLETALNIAHSCGHFRNGVEVMTVSGSGQVKEILEQMKNQIISEPGKSYALVIDGHSLTTALASHRELLSEVGERCEAVVCCRMSPIQKAEVVKLVKEFPQRPITAAIGDGANDVSMIQEAHIGLGIMGKEGRQAVRCADFAFARFKFLKKVLLVHGHWYYWRVATLVQYFFYKNMAFITPVVFFSAFSAYSTQPLYDSFFLTFYNILFTSLPIFIYGLFEQNYSAPMLLENVHLYKDITANASMSWGQFIKWNILGLWHAIAIYFGAMGLWQMDPAFFAAGYTLDFATFGTLVYHVVIFVVSLKLLIESRYWTWLFGFSIFISVVGFIGLTFLYSEVPIAFLDNESFQRIYTTLLSTGSSWLYLFVAIWIALLPDILVAVWDAYSAGGGVLANKKVTPGEIVEKVTRELVLKFSRSRFNVCKIGVTHEEDDREMNEVYHQVASHSPVQASRAPSATYVSRVQERREIVNKIPSIRVSSLPTRVHDDSETQGDVLNRRSSSCSSGAPSRSVQDE